MRLADGNGTQSTFEFETSKEMRETREKNIWCGISVKRALKYQRRSQNFIVSSLSSIHLDVIVEMKWNEQMNKHLFVIVIELRSAYFHILANGCMLKCRVEPKNLSKHWQMTINHSNVRVCVQVIWTNHATWTLYETIHFCIDLNRKQHDFNARTH